MNHRNLYIMKWYSYDNNTHYGYFYQVNDNQQIVTDSNGFPRIEYRMSNNESWPSVLKMEYVRTTKKRQYHIPFPMVRSKK